jgi:hypothetical protein
MDAQNDVTQEIVERALELLLALTGSRMAAVYSCGDEDQSPALVAGLRISQPVLDRVTAAWRYGRDALAIGKRYDCSDGGLVEPVLVERRLRALIYLEPQGAACPADQFELVRALIAKRFAESDAASSEPAISVDEREHLLLMLERNEWNIARVARLLGVSRLTVYRWLRRLGINRPEEGVPGELAPVLSRNG